MMGIGEGMGLVMLAAAILQSFCVLCCSPYLFLSQSQLRRGEVPQQWGVLFSQQKPCPVACLFFSCRGSDYCEWPTGRSAAASRGRKESLVDAQLAQPWTCTKATATWICTGGFGLWGSDDDSPAWLLDVPNPFGEEESSRSTVHSGLVSSHVCHVHLLFRWGCMVVLHDCVLSHVLLPANRREELHWHWHWQTLASQL